MRKSIHLLLTAILLAAMLTGCETLPTADFTFEPSEITVYDEVTFTNISSDAESYAWDFGDGSTSFDANPTHVFRSAGTFTVKLTATNEDGDSEVQKEIVVSGPDNKYMLDGEEFAIDSEMFWYQSGGMGGATVTYIRLLTTVPGQDNPDLLKLYPNMGLGELPGTYTWDSENPPGTYDAGYTANYAGMSYDWTAIGKTGSGNLVITELDDGVYKFEAEIILSVGNYNFETGEFIETGTSDLTLDYIGGVTPL